MPKASQRFKSLCGHGIFRSGLTFNGYSQRDVHVVVPVDDDLFHDHLQNLLSLLNGQLVQARADIPRPCEDSFR